MIKAIITAEGQTKEFEFPLNRETEYFSQLKEMGVLMPLWAVKVSNAEHAFPKVTLTSDSDFGAHLVRLFDGCTLGDVNEMTEAILKTREDIRTELEQDIIHDQYISPEDVYDSIHEMTYSLGSVTETYYFPLSGEIYDSEYDGAFEIDNYAMLGNLGLISERLAGYIGRGENMASYFDGAGHEKVLLADWGFAELNGVLYGKVDARLTEPFTNEEKEAFRDWIRGQNSDGLGEGFEQREIRTEEGDLYVSFWHSGNDYFVYDQNEMSAYLNQNMSLGGM